MPSGTHVIKLIFQNLKWSNIDQHIFSLWNRHHHDSIKEILKELNWTSLKDRRKQSHLILLCKIVNKLLLLPDRCLPSSNLSAARSHHDHKFNQIQSSVNTYLYSFLPRTIPQWTFQIYPTLILKV